MSKILLVVLVFFVPIYPVYANDLKSSRRRISAVDTNAMIANHIEALTERQAVLAENVANANTPGYKAKDMDLRQFQKAHPRLVSLQTTSQRHIPGVKHAERKPHIIKTPGMLKPNGNDVELPNQMAKVAANQDEYNKAVRGYMVTTNLLSSVLGNGGGN